MTNSISGITTNQPSATFPFANFNFTNFTNFDSFKSAGEFFSADNSFGEEKTFEFAFFTSFSERTFNEFKDFFVNEFAPKVKKGSFVKISFFADFHRQFDFTTFDKISNEFLQHGSVVEFSFLPSSSNFNFDEFNFSEFKFPFGFSNGDFMFSFSTQPTSR